MMRFSEYERHITLERARLWLRLLDTPRPVVSFEPIKASGFRSFYERRVMCNQFLGHNFSVGGSKK
jgi:hypothetical protein